MGYFHTKWPFSRQNLLFHHDFHDKTSLVHIKTHITHSLVVACFAFVIHTVCHTTKHPTERKISPAPCLPVCDSQHGTCIAGKCDCDDGWNGETCQERQCHERCEEHGICSNGECVCSIGWNGDLCSFGRLVDANMRWDVTNTFNCITEGCPDNCGSHGQCRKASDNTWTCSCDNGWKGVDCSTQVEMTCDDGRDNDRGQWSAYTPKNTRWLLHQYGISLKGIIACFRHFDRLPWSRLLWKCRLSQESALS